MSPLFKRPKPGTTQISTSPLPDARWRGRWSSPNHVPRHEMASAHAYRVWQVTDTGDGRGPRGKWVVYPRYRRPGAWIG
jgi:hypothetical protein